MDRRRRVVNSTSDVLMIPLTMSTSNTRTPLSTDVAAAVLLNFQVAGAATRHQRQRPRSLNLKVGPPGVREAASRP